MKNTETWDRCHSLGKKVMKKNDFAEMTRELPKERFGNGSDWEKAEDEGKIKPVDFIAGVSIKRDKLMVQKDFELDAKVEGMPEIIFSHKKHTVWNGCELCHPELFIGIKKGNTKDTPCRKFTKANTAGHAMVQSPFLSSIASDAIPRRSSSGHAKNSPVSPHRGVGRLDSTGQGVLCASYGGYLWRSRTLGNSALWGIAYGNGTFVAIGDNAAIYQFAPGWKP